MANYEKIELGNLFFGNSRGEFPVNRDWQDEFVKALNEMNICCDGSYDLDNEFTTKYNGFENEVFSTFPYYWGDDEELCEKPNFIYKPTGYSIQWYKYALRDSYANQDITFEQLKEILEACKASVRK